MRVLICGNRSFAAQGLTDLLLAHGHEVITFNRGPLGYSNQRASGPVLELDRHPDLAGPFDTIINYIFLKDEDIAQNQLYIDVLLRCCVRVKATHLIHISSVSVYSSRIRHVTENEPIENDPLKKGSYGSLKVASDQQLLTHRPKGLTLTLVRPGFILGAGLLDPMIGMGFRFAANRILMIGSGRNVLPVTTRTLVNQTVLGVLGHPLQDNTQVCLVLDNRSPTRREWLTANARISGAGMSVLGFPVLLWHFAGISGELVARIAGMKFRPYKAIRNACRIQSFDSSVTQKRFGIDMRIDWQKELQASLPDQNPQFIAPYRRIQPAALRASHVTFWGFGQIVKQKHLPALKRLGFTGHISAYDLTARHDESGVEVRALANAIPEPTDLMVIASPGPLHAQAIAAMRGVDAPILVEKPLCYRGEELQRWVEFGTSRTAPVLVCHNYRFKSNVSAMMEHLALYNPGRLIEACVHFQSPTIGKEWRTWTRNERQARTLLMDYSVHFLDIACMFASQWSVQSARYNIDHLGHTATIQGHLISPEYRVNFLLRQGHIPRRGRIFFTFQNYGVSLGFAPDIFVPHMTDDCGSLYGLEKRAAHAAFRSKLLDKITGRDSDHSHDLVYLAALTNSGEIAHGISLPRLAGFYTAMAELGVAVYESIPGS